MNALPRAFLARPIAHRGLHGEGRPENSLAAIRAAARAGYGVEIDVRPSAEGRAMVFHDATLARMTGADGRISDRAAAAIGRLSLPDGSAIPTLAEALDAAGDAPLLIEIKDQDGGLGPDIGELPAAVAADLARIPGPVAVMSFNPYAMAAMAAAAPDVPRGLTTCAFDAAGWPDLPGDRRTHLAAMADLPELGAAFISHDVRDLASPAVAAARAAGHAVLCWTVRSAEAEARARLIADNVTFEGYLP